MRVGLNATSFHPGSMGGMETYFRNLVDRVQVLDHENEYLILCDKRFAKEVPLVNPNFRLEYINYAKPSPAWFLRGAVRNIFNRDMLAGRMNRVKADVIHHPFTVLTPPDIKLPSVLTFWDMQHEFFPEFFSRTELLKRQRLYRISSERATQIIVSATFTKECLTDRYGIEAEKIEVIHTGYGPEYRPVDNSELLAAIRDKYGLARPFLLYPAATWPHKNHKRLLAALKLMRERHAFEGLLVLTGIAMQSHSDIQVEISRLGLTDDVKILGYLPAADLPGLYNCARLMVFPSLFEGFGIPLVEAMACGCPVVCSNTTSLPEVAGDAGVTFDPLDSEAMATAIWSVWNDEGELTRMRAQGLERASRFNWNDTARKTMAVYKKACGAA
ncbi:MAG TPA: glycosyltransferase family 4 protein [Desulfuromonadales bacterium]|nr:glycosyltransferase family 4 protein [Desulfuromonadales bacterium]